MNLQEDKENKFIWRFFIYGILMDYGYFLLGNLIQKNGSILDEDIKFNMWRRKSAY